jgi:putative ABC transport system substrate-binding protein
VRRREFITLLGGVAAWPLAARAQQPQRMRRIGVLGPSSADDADYQARHGAFLQELQRLGWTIGHNLQFDYRYGAGDVARIRAMAAELVALAPDVIVASGTSTIGPLLQVTRTVPVVFPVAVDPVGAGFVESLARPGGNATGFITFEFNFASKWLELLTEIAPNVTRVAVLRDFANSTDVGQLGVLHAAASALRMEVSPLNMQNVPAIEHALAAFARTSNGGLIVTAGALALVHRELIVGLAARHNLPAVYPFRYHVVSGGLLSYGPNFIDQYRQAAGYVDRILKGEKPADLPVQAPTKYELAINLKTAKALGLTVPDALLARADEVIE